jgi:glycosyltransferase involved in cell wall biosynthesis
MKILILTDIFNHHLSPFFDFIRKKYGAKNVTYIYITDQISLIYDDKIKFDCIKLSNLSINNFDDYFFNSDIVYFSVRKFLYKAIKRSKKNKTTFYFSERWFKPEFYFLKILNPLTWLNLHNLNNNFKYNSFYYLAQGQFAKNDITKFIGRKKNILDFGYFNSDINLKNNVHYIFYKKIIWIGRTIKWKNIKLFLNAIKSIDNLYNDLEFTIILVTNKVDYYNNLILNFNFKNKVNIYFNLDHKDVIDILSKNDLLIITSNSNEGWGYVANEAIESRVNIISSDEIGAVNIMLYNFENSITFNSGNLTDLIFKINFYLQSDFIRNKIRHHAKIFAPFNPILKLNNLTNTKFKTNKYKIAIIYPFLPSYRIPIFNRLINNDQYKFEIIFGLNNSDVNSLDKDISLFKSIKFPFSVVKNIYIKNFLFQLGLFNKVKKNKYDGYIFLGDPHFITSIFLFFYLKMIKKPIILWTHGISKDTHFIKKFLYYLYYKLSDLLFVYSNNSKYYLSSLSFNVENIFNSLNYDLLFFYRTKINEDDLLNFRNNIFGKIVLFQLVFIGRLTFKKNLLSYLVYFKSLISKGFDFNFIIIGSGEQEHEIRNYININNLTKNVLLLKGNYNESDIFKYIASSDLSIYPSEVGLSCIHSLSYGTPVITHDDYINNMPESEAIIPGINGDYFKHKDFNHLNFKIIEWYKINKCNSRKNIRERCYSIVDKYYNPEYQNEIIIKSLNKLFNV